MSEFLYLKVCVLTLIHYILVDSSTVLCWMCPFVILRDVGPILFYFFKEILLANNVDPDQMPHYVAFDLGVHCMPMTLLQVSR